MSPFCAWVLAEFCGHVIRRLEGRVICLGNRPDDTGVWTPASVVSSRLSGSGPAGSAYCLPPKETNTLSLVQECFQSAFAESVLQYPTIQCLEAAQSFGGKLTSERGRPSSFLAETENSQDRNILPGLHRAMSYQ